MWQGVADVSEDPHSGNQARKELREIQKGNWAAEPVEMVSATQHRGVQTAPLVVLDYEPMEVEKRCYCARLPHFVFSARIDQSPTP